jgi:hypothetical protein
MGAGDAETRRATSTSSRRRPPYDLGWDMLAWGLLLGVLPNLLIVAGLWWRRLGLSLTQASND